MWQGYISNDFIFFAMRTQRAGVLFKREIVITEGLRTKNFQGKK